MRFVPSSCNTSNDGRLFFVHIVVIHMCDYSGNDSSTEIWRKGFGETFSLREEFDSCISVQLRVRSFVIMLTVTGESNRFNASVSLMICSGVCLNKAL